MGNRFCEWADDGDGQEGRIAPAPMPAPLPPPPVAQPHVPFFAPAPPPPVAYTTPAGRVAIAKPLPRRNYIMKGATDGWDAALANVPDLVATGVVKNMNPEGYDACEAPGAPDGAVMEHWTPGARYVGGATDNDRKERVEAHLGRLGTNVAEVRSTEGMTISGRSR